jgi:hypothetical protein
MSNSTDPAPLPINRYIAGGYFYGSDGVPINVVDILKGAQSYDKSLVVSDDVKAFNSRGQLFDLSAKIPLSGNQTLYLVGKTNGSTVHFNFEQYASTLGGIEIRLLEGVTATGGVSITPICRNRANPKTSTFTITQGATVTNTGTELGLVGLPESGGPATGRGPQSGADMLEWILAGDTYYALEVKNINNSSKTLYAILSWYEPEA